MRLNAPPLLAALLFAGMSLAGCIGDSGPLAADFTAVSDDNKSFTFDASSSGGSPDQYLWDFGDGTTGEGVVVEHTYEYVNGEYDVTLTVVAGDVQRETTKGVMTGSAENQLPMLMVTVDKRYVKPGDEVLFDARASHDMDGDPIEITWDFNYGLSEDELEKLANVGSQQYEAGDPHAGHDMGGDERNGTESEPSSADPPSAEELREAWERYQTMLSERPTLVDQKPRHGGASEGGSPYAGEGDADFDGKINDTSPMQFFSWPSEGIYFVLIDVKDIKGDHTKGFVAIKVASDAPETQVSDEAAGTIDYIGPGLDLVLGAGQEPEGTRNYWRDDVDFPYPGTFSVSVAVSPTAGEGDVMLYVCRATASTWQDCEGNSRNLARAGPSADQLQATVNLGVKDPAYKFAVYVVGASDTPGAAGVNVTASYNMTFDTNPWFEHETGQGGGHGGH